ncbi:hypothetical protein [Phaeobacter sp. C3_T13_0]|uniref:hypothetical protein n=1 Tax=Phaeobacter cretensis TaxID=3342641 RepID=UPI0039BD2EF5
MTDNVEKTPSTTNECWGFWGTMSHRVHEFHLPHFWSQAFQQIGAATGQQNSEAVVAFLDGVQGRHFADSVADGLFDGLTTERAIAQAIKLWQGWTIGQRTSRDYDIPQGLPYLTGWVLWHEVQLDLVV